jgi:hypothetical protein
LGKTLPLNLPHQELIRVLNYVWLLVVWPIAVTILVGFSATAATLDSKRFFSLNAEWLFLSPLLNAVISDGNHAHHHRRK